MKKVFAVLLILALTLAGSGMAEGILRVGMECDYAPFNWTQAEQTETSVPISSGGYADGYDVQIAKRIAEAMGCELEIVKTEWDGLPMGIMSGSLDMIIAGMSPTAERKVTIDFSDPYYTSDLVIVVLADGAYAGAAKLDDFSGARITGQQNTFHYTVIDQIPGVDKQTAMATFPAMVVALSSGAIDGYVSERPGALSAVAANPGLSFVGFAAEDGFQSTPDDIAIAVGLKKGSELTEQVNQILAEITPEERAELMNQAVANQPLSE